MRTVTDYEKQSVYRARVEPHKSPIRRRSGWRFVIERCWSRLGSMAVAEDWRSIRCGDWVATEEEAKQQAEAWLDAAEAKADKGGYV